MRLLFPELRPLLCCADYPDCTCRRPKQEVKPLIETLLTKPSEEPVPWYLVR